MIKMSLYSKKYILMLVGLLVAGALFLTSCDDDDPEVIELLLVEEATAEGTVGGSPVVLDLNDGIFNDNVPVNASFTINFSENLDASTVNKTNIYLTEFGQSSLDITISESGDEITVVPDNDLQADTNYVLTVSRGVQSAEDGLFYGIDILFTTAP